VSLPDAIFLSKPASTQASKHWEQQSINTVDDDDTALLDQISTLPALFVSAMPFELPPSPPSNGQTQH
jgi:hypothetical protein